MYWNRFFSRRSWTIIRSLGPYGALPAVAIVLDRKSSGLPPFSLYVRPTLQNSRKQESEAGTDAQKIGNSTINCPLSALLTTENAVVLNLRSQRFRNFVRLSWYLCRLSSGMSRP